MTICILEVMKSAMAAGEFQEKATEWILNGHCVIMIDPERESNPDIKKWMAAHNYTDYSKLEQYYETT